MDWDNEPLKPLSFNKGNEALKPLNFDDEDALKPLSLDDKKETIDDHFVPIAKGKVSEIKNKDSNFVFFFGTASSGKSVILATMLYYLRSTAGVIRPKIGTPNTAEAESLLYDFFENISKGILPAGTVKDQVTRLDLVFEPNNKSKKVNPINLTFLETSGENHNEIRRGGNYHSSIETYLSANLPLTFIIVTSYENAHKDDILINTFLNRLEKYEKKLRSVNIILVISKWDKSGRAEVEDSTQLDDFIRERLPMTSTAMDTYSLAKTFYTVGELNEDTNRVTLLNLDRAKKLSEWLYESISGYPLYYEGTFWERIKFSFIN
ncbi:hypothetical protein [Chryseobacterium hagamense]|uniref:Uncharacterized protein n=1 Tax=Chryseobacterium hagamense TaxID=395935 RepID=A0A511YJ50_9FLAO|nr:hypothetical protein [Chryseobacterium hagamense]GEN75230.1 hypothetical protein CHA01nite_09700 [Chryseobacterium hagamense]